MGLAAELWQFGFKRISPAGTDNLVKDLLHKNIEFQTAGTELDQEKSDLPSSFAILYFEFSSCSRLVDSNRSGFLIMFFNFFPPNCFKKILL